MNLLVKSDGVDTMNFFEANLLVILRKLLSFTNEFNFFFSYKTFQITLFQKISIGSVLDVVFSAKDKDKENGNILLYAGCTLKVHFHVRQKLHEFAVQSDFKFVC